MNHAWVGPAEGSSAHRERSNSVQVAGQPGHGTTFRLTFPSAALTSSAGTTMSQEIIGRSLRILVVDDEPALVTMLARLLESDGHEVAVATSGEEALSILEHATVDVVISDLGMGAGMNGE